MKSIRTTAAVLALMLSGAGAARAGIVFDSITGSSPAAYISIAPTTGPLGDSFSTGPGASSLTDVKFDLYNPSNTPTGSITVSLFGSNGTNPTIPLANLSTSSTSALVSGVYTVEDFSGFSPIGLAASTRYYIILSTSNNSQLGAAVTSNLSGTGVGSEFIYLNGTTQSNASIGATFEMQVTTTSSASVPEPSSLILSGLAAFVGFAWKARRVIRAPRS